MSSKRYEGHTPGPWVVGGPIEDTGDVRIIDSSDEGLTVAFATWEGSLDDATRARTKANAHLIAAAPMHLRQRDELVVLVKRYAETACFRDQVGASKRDDCQCLSCSARALVARIEQEEAQS